MKLSDLDDFHGALPSMFKVIDIPGEFEEWHIVPVNSVESELPAGFNPADARGPEELNSPREDQLGPPEDPSGEWMASLPTGFPGGYVAGRRRRQGGGMPPPPPDALAFYLPAHFFYPRWWGIYLLREGVEELGRYLIEHVRLSIQDARLLAQVFLFKHEAFHHATESLAFRLEATHRRPLYRTSFQALFATTVGSDNCLEEALACAHALREVRKLALKRLGAQIGKEVQQAFERYTRACGPGYRVGVDLQSGRAFDSGKAKFAENNHKLCFPHLEPKDERAWFVFDHAFRPLCDIRARVNYLVHRRSLDTRTDLGLRYFNYRHVARKLQEHGCSFDRAGKGSHEIWRSPSGARFTLPRHRGVIADGTLRTILKEAGINMSLHQFAQAT